MSILNRNTILGLTAVVGVCSLAFLIYWPGLSGGLVFDDTHVLEDNIYIKFDILNIENLIQAAFSFSGGTRELSMLSFGLNHYIFGDNVWWFKFVNLVIHLCNGFGLFLFAKLILSRLDRSELLLNRTTDTLSPRVLAGSIAALWLLHPIQLTSVLYVSQRMTSLSALFVIFGLLLYVLGRNKLDGRKKSGWAFILVGLTGGTVLAFLSKENGVLLPVFSLLIELLIYRFKTNGKTDKHVVGFYALLCFAGLLVMFAGFLRNPTWIVDGYLERAFSLPERVLTEFRVLVLYLRMIIVPDNSILGIWHDDLVISTSILSPVTTLFSAIFLTAMFVFGVVLVIMNKLRLVAFGILLFFIGHSIESTIVSLEIMHEHRNYLASFGIAILIIILINSLDAAATIKGIAIFVLIGLNIAVLNNRVAGWSNPLAHAQMEATNHPNSPSAQNAVAREYFHLSQLAPNDDDKHKLLNLSYDAVLNAAALDKFTITSDVFLALLSKADDSIEYNPVWFEQAAEKFAKHPYMAPSFSSLNYLLKCYKDEVCDFPNSDIKPIFDVASESENPHFMTLAAVYYANNEKNHKKAAGLFAEAMHRGPGEPRYALNYIEVLLVLGELAEAQNILEKLKKAKMKKKILYREEISIITEKITKLSAM